MAQIDIPTSIVSRRQTRTYDTGADNSQQILITLLASLSPVGSFVPTALANQPDGDAWILCDGRGLDKDSFSRLYAIFGGSYGETETTFNVPDLRGRTMIGANPSIQLGAYAGSSEITLSAAQMPAHTHSVNDTGHVHSVDDPGHAHATLAAAAQTASVAMGTGATEGTPGQTEAAQTGVAVQSATTGISIDSAGEGNPIDITPPSFAVNWLVRA